MFVLYLGPVDITCEGSTVHYVPFSIKLLILHKDLYHSLQSAFVSQMKEMKFILTLLVSKSWEYSFKMNDQSWFPPEQPELSHPHPYKSNTW
jgi:hypothetical protein